MLVVDCYYDEYCCVVEVLGVIVVLVLEVEVVVYFVWELLWLCFDVCLCEVLVVFVGI